VAGVILWSQEPESAAPSGRRLPEAGTPVAAIDRPLPDCPSDFVGVDNAQGSAVAVRHLLDSGRRRIVHVTIEGNEAPIRNRAVGYREALQDAAVPEGDCRVLTLGHGYQESACMDAFIRVLLGGAPRPDAIFAVNDIVAWGLVHALRRAGCRVPDDIAVVGFDDIEAPTFHKPFLTTIRQPFEDIGRNAATLLLRRIQTPRMPIRHVLLGTSLIVRGSTSPAGALPGETPQRAAPLRDYALAGAGSGDIALT
jgi:DNA-binding LacI/PurR family transcriptional regulator